MAIGSTAFTKRRIHKLQQTIEHSECSLESEPEFLQAQESVSENKSFTSMSHTRELAAGLDFVAVDYHNGITLCLEILPIQTQSGI